MSSSSSGAELNRPPNPSGDLPLPASLAWKQEANHRLAAHRARRSGRDTQQSALPGMEEKASGSHSSTQRPGSSVADRVAARYEKAPTYSEMLAAEARNAARAAEAAAVAAGAARDAANAILIGLDVELQAASQPGAPSTPPSTNRVSADRQPAQSSYGPAISSKIEPAEPFAPIEEPAPIAQPLPAKLLEFPRELIAARKARPRLAEGPLREEFDRDAAQSQLRIFEVEQERISTEPTVEPARAEWSSIRLDPAPSLHEAGLRGRDPFQERQVSLDNLARSAAGLAARETPKQFELPLQSASIEDRLMAAIVDAALIMGAFLTFALVFASCTTRLPWGMPMLVGAVSALCAFAVLYLLLFFSFGHDTPGMRYARIALCTFDDANPTRHAARRRLGALLLSASPLGIGVLWALFDDDRLGWHDRISRTYQRSYR